MKIVTRTEYMEKQNIPLNIDQNDEALDQTVLEMIKKVRQKGDKALRNYTEKFDKVSLESLFVTEEEFKEATSLVSDTFKQAIKKAYERIKSFHTHQLEKSWFINEDDGVLLGQKVTPIKSVGIYVPGGKAAYPSSVLMNAIPAKIAGVKEIVMTTPVQSDGKVNPHVLVAALEAGVTTIYKVGGAQAIAALAYGTETVQKVSKIVGPGNAYVACAKKWVFGDVAIDMIAGPSEIAIVADESTNPTYAAADLLSQAEHDEQAKAICITTSQTFAKALQNEIEEQTELLERKAIIKKSLDNYGRIIMVDSMEEAFQLVNELAPEHLQVMTESPADQLSNIQHAGAIFLGNHSPEALGDYLAGPNHTLPTSGTATFSSPLGVYDFLKRSSIIQYSETALREVSNEIITIANAEGLTAHGVSIKKRMENE